MPNLQVAGSPAKRDAPGGRALDPSVPSIPLATIFARAIVRRSSFARGQTHRLGRQALEVPRNSGTGRPRGVSSASIAKAPSKLIALRRAAGTLQAADSRDNGSSRRGLSRLRMRRACAAIPAARRIKNQDGPDVASSTSSDSQVTDRYATALFELAEEAGELDAAENALLVLRETFAASAELAEALRNPAFTRADKKAVMARVAEASGAAGPTFDGFLGALESHGRFAFLPAICDRFAVLMSEHRGETNVQVTAARPLSDVQSEALAAKVGETIGGVVKLDVTVDPALIGGLVVRVGSKMIDSSIRSKLANLQTAMKEIG